MSADAVELGLMFPFTGNAQSLFRPFRAGVDARLGVANDAGGVFGREVGYTWRDDESRLSANLAAARQLIEIDDVFGIIESTSVASGSAEYLYDKGVPVTGASLEKPWTVYDNMFSYSNLIADGPSVSTWGDFVHEHGGRRAVLAVSTFSEASLAMSEQLAESLRSAGVEVVGTVEATAPIDLDRVGQQVADSGADTLVGAVTGAAFAQVVVGARNKGADLKVILSPTGYDQSMLELVGHLLAGVYYFVDYVPFEFQTPAHERFVAAMTEYAPHITPPNQQVALAGWIAADMFLRGLAEAGQCPTRVGFLRGLRAVTDYDADGLIPEPVNFTADFGKITLCYTFLQVTGDGKKFEVIPPAPRCGSRLE